jgi:hypothetical protein
MGWYTIETMWLQYYPPTSTWSKILDVLLCQQLLNTLADDGSHGDLGWLRLGVFLGTVQRQGRFDNSICTSVFAYFSYTFKKMVAQVTYVN